MINTKLPDSYFITRGVKCGSFELAASLAIDGLKWQPDSVATVTSYVLVVESRGEDFVHSYKYDGTDEWTGHSWFRHDD